MPPPVRTPRILWGRKHLSEHPGCLHVTTHLSRQAAKKQIKWDRTYPKVLLVFFPLICFSAHLILPQTLLVIIYPNHYLLNICFILRAELGVPSKYIALTYREVLQSLFIYSITSSSLHSVPHPVQISQHHWINSATLQMQSSIFHINIRCVSPHTTNYTLLV